MKGKIKQEHFLIIGKCFLTTILLGIIFLWTLVVFILLPFALALLNNGKKKRLSGLNLAIAMSPILVIWQLITKVWKDNKYNEYEKEFLKGFHEGQIEGHFEEGKRQGYTSVATQENLKPIPVYNIRGRK